MARLQSTAYAWEMSLLLTSYFYTVPQGLINKSQGSHLPVPDTRLQHILLLTKTHKEESSGDRCDSQLSLLPEVFQVLPTVRAIGG